MKKSDLKLPTESTNIKARQKKKWHDRKVRLKDKELVNLVLQRVAVRDRYPLGPHGADQSMGRLRA